VRVFEKQKPSPDRNATDAIKPAWEAGFPSCSLRENTQNSPQFTTLAATPRWQRKKQKTYAQK
jgi:hypothetical protein